MASRDKFIQTGDRQGLTDRELKDAGWIDNEGNVRQTGGGREGGASTERTFDETPGDRNVEAEKENQTIDLRTNQPEKAQEPDDSVIQLTPEAPPTTDDVVKLGGQTPEDRKFMSGTTSQKIKDFLIGTPKVDGQDVLLGYAPNLGFGGETTKAALNIENIRKGGDVALNVARNAKSAALSSSMISRVVAQYKKPAFVATAIFAMIGNYAWGEWAFGEAIEGMEFAVTRATKSGNVELMKFAAQEQNEILDTNIWEGIARLLPTNLIHGFWQKFKALKAQAHINNKIVEDTIIQIETGETEDDKWARIKEEEKESDKATVDYYNEQRKLQVQWEEESRKAASEAARDASRSDEVKARNEDAEFWRSEQEKTRKAEEADRNATAEFWIQYRKTVAKMKNDNTPSNLNFGLL